MPRRRVKVPRYYVPLWERMNGQVSPGAPSHFASQGYARFKKGKISVKGDFRHEFSLGMVAWIRRDDRHGFVLHETRCFVVLKMCDDDSIKRKKKSGVSNAKRHLEYMYLYY